MVSDRFRMALRTAPVLALAAVPLAGCSTLDSINPFGAGEKYETKILAETPASDIYDQGLARLQKKDGAGAAKKFSELDKQYPFSDWSRKGLMMQTYANYQAGDFDTAITTGKHFYQLYPNAPDAPYALYLQAMSYYQQIPDVSRDQENAAKALNLFQQIVAKYPTSEYADDSKYKIQVTRDQLAGKEMSTGRFYLNRSNLRGRHQPLPRGPGEVPDHAPRRGGAGAPDRGLSGAGRHQRGADRRRRARPQFPLTAPGTRTPSPSSRRTASSPTRTRRLGSRGPITRSSADVWRPADDTAPFRFCFRVCRTSCYRTAGHSTLMRVLHARPA